MVEKSMRNLSCLVVGCAAILAVTLLLFAKATGYGLCAVDDYAYLLEHEFVANGLSWSGIVESFSFVGEAIWMPLTWITYMLDHSAGWGAKGMHLCNVFVHSINAVVFFLVLVRLCRILNRDFILLPILSALIWAVHPLRVESVVWIASRKDELSTLFFLLAIFTWLGGTGLRFCLVSALFIFVGAMAKPSVMVFPVFAIVLDCLITGQRKTPFAYVLIVIACSLVALESVWGQSCGAMGASQLIPMWYKMVNAICALTVYLGNIVWPKDLAVQCLIRYPAFPRFSFLGALLLFAMMAYLLWAVVPRIRCCVASRNVQDLMNGDPVVNVLISMFLMFFCCLVPFLGIVGFGFHAFADRFTLLPSLSASIALVAIICRLKTGRMSYRFVCYGCFFIVAVFACRTTAQIGFWENDGTLFEHTLAVDGESNVVAQRAIGHYYWNEERNLEKVYTHMKRAVEDSAKDSCIFDMMSVCNLLIDVAYDLGKREEADEYYFAMAKWNHNSGVRNSMEFLMADGLFNLQRKDFEGAKRDLSEMEEKHPDYYATRYLAYRIALAEGDSKRTLEALRNCPTSCREDAYGRNTWAVKMLAAGPR